jgi:hypothetical protein
VFFWLRCFFGGGVFDISLDFLRCVGDGNFCRPYTSFLIHGEPRGEFFLPVGDAEKTGGKHMKIFRKKMFRLCLFTFLVAMVFAFAACGGESEDERAERERFETLVSELENFRNFAATGRVHAEAMSEQIENIWAHAERETLNPQTLRYVVSLSDGSWDYINIPATTTEIVEFLNENAHTFNTYSDALILFTTSAATEEMRQGVEQARNNMREARAKLVNPPEELRQAVATAGLLFDAFDNLVNLVNNPSGNLGEYSQRRNEIIADLVTHHRQLGEQISEIG